MMGHSHALTGWCAGLAVAPLVGLHTLPEVLPFATAAAGYALLPDLDHPGATASRFLGPLTGLLSRLLRLCSRGLYALTKGPRDEPGRSARPTGPAVQAGPVRDDRAVVAGHPRVGTWS